MVRENPYRSTGKLARPLVIVPANVRNNHPRATSVLVIPLSTTIHKSEVPTHLSLEPGQPGLSQRVLAKAEDISLVRKSSLQPPRHRLGNLSATRLVRSRIWFAWQWTATSLRKCFV